MDNLKKIVELFCRSLAERDAWMYSETCKWIVENVDYEAEFTITQEGAEYTIKATLKDGREIEMKRTHDAFAIRYGAC